MEYLCIGKIVNTHGIKGEVRLLSDFKFKNKVFVDGFVIYIGKDKVKEVINSYRPHKQFDMITIKGIININDVLKYKGSKVYISKNDLVLDDNEYLDEDLIGFDVFMNKELRGRVVKIKKDTYQKQLVVNKEGKEYLVPLVYGIIKDINLNDGIITLDDIGGLLD